MLEGNLNWMALFYRKSNCELRCVSVGIYFLKVIYFQIVSRVKKCDGSQDGAGILGRYCLLLDLMNCFQFALGTLSSL